VSAVEGGGGPVPRLPHRLKGIVSKRTDAPGSGPSKTWVKTKNPGEQGGAAGAQRGVALASAHPGLHGSPTAIRCINSAVST
jgi:hypothetical protein